MNSSDGNNSVIKTGVTNRVTLSETLSIKVRVYGYVWMYLYICLHGYIWMYLYIWLHMDVSLYIVIWLYCNTSTNLLA